MALPSGRESLDPILLADATARLREANLAFAHRYPGDGAARQPVHTLIEGAHHFTPTIARERGDEALRMLDSNPGISAIFTDVVMPGSLDGAALAARVRDSHPHVTVIVTSGEPGYDPATLPAEVRFLPKPYTGHEVIRLIGDLSAGNDLRQAAFA